MKSLFTLVACLLMAATTSAQEWRVLKQRADGNKSFATYPTSVLLDDTKVEVSESGSGSFTIHRIVAIQNAEGALANRVLKYDYDPLTAFAEFAEVTIYRTNGQVDKLDVKSACDYAAPARAIYWGARQIMIEVGRLEKGDVIDYTISKKGFTYALLASTDEERFVPPMRGEFYDIVPFWVSQPTVKKSYTVSFPAHKDVQYEFYQGECRSSSFTANGRKTMTFVVENSLPFKKESNMVDLFDVAPKLMMSSTPTWKEKSLWFHGVNEEYGSFEPLPAAQKKVDELLKGVTDEMERISILTHWVADNIRYSGISMGKGEGYTLHNTEMNFTDRCGVCKDKAALLISMLRMAGHEAHPAMTMAGSRIEAIAADHFNHCVAVVKLQSGVYIPLDPTWVPFNREIWSSAEQQQNYLPGTPEGSDLLLSEVSAPENHYLRIYADTKVDENGTLSGTYTVMAEGQSDAAVRRPFLQGYAERTMRALESELMNVSPEARITGVEVNDPKNYQAAPIEMTISFEIPSYATVGEGVIIVKPLVYSDLYKGVRTFLRVDTTNEERKYAFKDSCSRLVELKETMTLPEGYIAGGNTQSNGTGGSNIAKFDYNFSVQNNTLTVEHTLALYKRVYEAEDWTSFRNAVNTYKEQAAKSYIFEKK